MWVLNPQLWDAARKKAASETNEWTYSFWRKVKEIYERIGGQWVEGDQLEYAYERYPEQSDRPALLGEGLGINPSSTQAGRPLLEPILTADRTISPTDL